MFDFFAKRFSHAFSYLTGQRYLTEKNVGDTIAKMRETLLDADVPFEVVERFVDEIKQEVIGKKVVTSLKAPEQFVNVVYEKLVAFLGNKEEIQFTQRPATIMVMGLQGSGKTTTIAKLAHYFITQQKVKPASIVCASVDFYRPAAIDQLEILARQVGCQWFRAQSQSAVPAALEIYEYAKKQNTEILLLDTAGRLHVDESMIIELKEINKKINPNYTLLVLDAMTGQESLHVAQSFQNSIGFQGAILTKLDSETRAGAAFAFRYQLQKPIVFLGHGEKIDDLELFKPDRMASRMLGMGDMQTLLERAQRKIKESEQQDMEKSLNKGAFTLVDFAKQLEMINRLGSFGQLLKYMPGMAGAAVSPEALNEGEVQMKKFKAIISSMTLKERYNPKLLNSSRKQRIARGSGTSSAEINLLLDRFEKIQQFVKLYKSGKFPGLY